MADDLFGEDDGDQLLSSQPRSSGTSSSGYSGGYTYPPQPHQAGHSSYGGVQPSQGYGGGSYGYQGQGSSSRLPPSSSQNPASYGGHYDSAAYNRGQTNTQSMPPQHYAHGSGVQGQQSQQAYGNYYGKQPPPGNSQVRSDPARGASHSGNTPARQGHGPANGSHQAAPRPAKTSQQQQQSRSGLTVLINQSRKFWQVFVQWSVLYLVADREKGSRQMRDEMYKILSLVPAADSPSKKEVLFRKIMKTLGKLKFTEIYRKVTSLLLAIFQKVLARMHPGLEKQLPRAGPSEQIHLIQYDRKLRDLLPDPSTNQAFYDVFWKQVMAHMSKLKQQIVKKQHEKEKLRSEQLQQQQRPQGQQKAAGSTKIPPNSGYPHHQQLQQQQQQMYNPQSKAVPTMAPPNSTKQQPYRPPVNTTKTPQQTVKPPIHPTQTGMSSYNKTPYGVSSRQPGSKPYEPPMVVQNVLKVDRMPLPKNMRSPLIDQRVESIVKKKMAHSLKNSAGPSQESMAYLSQALQVLMKDTIFELVGLARHRAEGSEQRNTEPIAVKARNLEHRVQKRRRKDKIKAELWNTEMDLELLFQFMHEKNDKSPKLKRSGETASESNTKKRLYREEKNK
uniref:Uncharacterized protein n=1 Tax=Mucochytrium quahogii TaxID=96639 RepID=A0A7S2SEF8_9STRA|mmetsp:Transcript_4723/g.10349  ORF Transcript_4723/g.10349 Transcript_4723/m.10349 type:complete len:614 (+) Transcript_4723:3-1844(+)